MDKHTPGPWEVNPQNPLVIGIHVQPFDEDDDSEFRIIADVYGGAFEGREAEANARLIAAAPEMLALLDQAHSALQMAIASKKMGWFQDAVFADIGALLSRIEGETE